MDVVPSEIGLTLSMPPSPLFLAFGEPEPGMELAAACLVRACQIRGDRWQKLSALDILMAIITDRTFCLYLRRPGRPRPDYVKLAARGYVSGDVEHGGDLEFTEKGLEAIALWRRPKQ